MINANTSHCQPIMGGKPVSETAFVEWELERGRVALALLKKNLGIEGLQKLLAGETAESARKMDEWIANSEEDKWVESRCDIEVSVGSAREFMEWFKEIVAANDQETLDAACPEHYVVTPTPEGALDVIETTGGFGLPSRLIMRLGADESIAPDPSIVDAEYPIRMIGRGYQVDGPEMVRVFHQFTDTENGFKAKLRAFWPEASAKGLVEGHNWHLCCEFTHWVNSYLESKGLR